MENKDKKLKIEQKTINIKVFHLPDEKPEFVPWEAGKKNEQFFIKLKRKDEVAFLYAGENEIVEADVKKRLFKLTNDGWEIQGEIGIEFDGKQEDEFDDLFERDIIRVEVGINLLPLVDPVQGAFLMDAVRELRKEIVRATGFITPGIRVKDNLILQPNNYVIYLKETPVSAGEIFLDRFMAIGTLEQLAKVQGWSTKDPSYNTPAKWIEAEEREKADEAGCILLGPLNILITHLRESVVGSLKEMLGMQDVKNLLDRLTKTHPVVVEDFLKDKKKIRLVRRILQNLVAERVSIRDMVTILETLGDYEDQLEKTDLVTEMVRISLARQICWSYLDEEGKITALVLSRKFEEMMQNSIRETKHGLRLTLTTDEVDSIIRYIRKAMEDFKNPGVIFCDPPTRLYFRRLTEPNFPHLGILSTAEISRGMKIEIIGEIDLPPDIKMPVPATAPEMEEEEEEAVEYEEEKKKESKGFFDFMK